MSTTPKETELYRISPKGEFFVIANVSAKEFERIWHELQEHGRKTLERHGITGGIPCLVLDDEGGYWLSVIRQK